MYIPKILVEWIKRIQKRLEINIEKEPFQFAEIYPHHREMVIDNTTNLFEISGPFNTTFKIDDDKIYAYIGSGVLKGKRIHIATISELRVRGYFISEIIEELKGE